MKAQTNIFRRGEYERGIRAYKVKIEKITFYNYKAILIKAGE